MNGMNNRANTQNRRKNTDERLKEAIGEKMLDWFGFVKKLNPKHWFAQGEIDLYFFITVVILVLAGIIINFSTVAPDFAKGGGTFIQSFQKDILILIVGFILMIITSKLRTDFIKEFSVLVFVISFLLLIAVLFYHTVLPGREGIKRYIPLLGIQFQPSEIAKLGLIMFTAWGAQRNKKGLEKNWYKTLPWFIPVSLFTALTLKEHHLSGAILMLAIGIVMLFFSGVKLRWFIMFGPPLLILAVLVVVLIYYAHKDPSAIPGFIPESIKDRFVNNIDKRYEFLRIIAWLDKDFSPREHRYQTNSSLYSIANGGLFGRGLGNSIRKYGHLPEASNDFIFAIICEELGFLGGAAVLALFAFLMWRAFVIAKNAKDRFSTLLTLGIATQVGLQTFLHIAVVTDMVPNTGIGLPFISSGGTSIVTMLVQMGLILGVSRTAKIKKD